MPTRMVWLLPVLFSLPVAAQAVPDRILVGYWHNWAWPIALALNAVPDAYDVVNVAFAVPSVPGGSTMQFTPASGIYPNPQDFINDIAVLQAAGKRVLISIGGANDPIVIDTPAAARNFASSMAQIIATYGFDGMDMDLEGSSLMLQSGDTDHRAPTTGTCTPGARSPSRIARTSTACSSPSTRRGCRSSQRIRRSSP